MATEYKWKEYTFDQNIENKISNLAENGWTVKTMILRQWGIDLINCLLYVLYEKTT